MKNKGFTLIELLGVIILLALLMIIVFPSIINSVKNSSSKTDSLTLDLIYNASDLYISRYEQDFPKANGSKYVIKLKDLVEEEFLVSPINLSGSDEDITNNKCIEISYNDGYQYELKDIGTCEEIWKPMLTGDFKTIGTIDIGDIISIGKESFYVISSDETKTIMLAKYNLKDGMQDSYTKDADSASYYGATAFSSNPYFWNNTQLVDSNYASQGRKYPYVYGNYEANYLYDDLENYKEMFEEKNVTIIDSKLISFEQLEELGCVQSTDTSADCTQAPSWLYSTSYWTGSSTGAYYTVWAVNRDGSVNEPYYNSSNHGIRPLIKINKAEILGVS